MKAKATPTEAIVMAESRDSYASLTLNKNQENIACHQTRNRNARVLTEISA